MKHVHADLYFVSKSRVLLFKNGTNFGQIIVGKSKIIKSFKNSFQSCKFFNFQK